MKCLGIDQLSAAVEAAEKLVCTRIGVPGINLPAVYSCVFGALLLLRALFHSLMLRALYVCDIYLVFVQVLSPRAERFVLSLFEQFSSDTVTSTGRVLTQEDQKQVMGRRWHL